MRKLCLPLPRILLPFFIVVAALCGGFDAARADDPACQVTGLRGSAMLNHAGSRSALVAGAALSAGDTITTDAGARVKLRFADGSEIRLGENAELRIESVKIDAAAGTRNILLRLPIGLLRAAAAKLSKNSGSSFEIHTGVGYSAVRGTHWIVAAQKAETRVYVQEGRVAVGADFETSGFPKMVEPGRWVSVSRKAGIGAVEDVPPGSLDGLIEQTEASLAPGDDDAESVTETAFGILDDDTSLPGAASNAVSNVADAVADAAGAAVGQTTSAVSNVTGAVVGAAGAAVDQTTATVSNVAGAVGNVAGAAVDQTSSAVSAATGAVASTVSATTSAVSNTTSAVTGALGMPGSGSASNGSSDSSSGGTPGGGSSSGGGASSGGGSSSGGPSGGSGSSSGGGSDSGGSGSGSSSGGPSSGGGKLGGSVRSTLGKVGGLLK